MLIALTMVLILIAGYLLFKPDKSPTIEENKQIIPIAKNSETKTEFKDYSFDFGNLKIQYPSTWNLVEGANNDEDSHIVTIESLMDVNKFYYCIDFNEYSAKSSKDVDFSVKDAKIFSVEDFSSKGISKPLKKVNYQLKSGLIMTTISDDDTITNKSTVFDQSITNPSGRKLQIFGRFNCRDKERPEISYDDYSNSQVYDEGLQALLRISY